MTSRPNLDGTGAAYIRVSTDQQDTERQYESVRSFEQRYEVSIAARHWFKDEGWARDKADTRPDFQRLFKAVEAGEIQWIVVDALDRFGTKNSKQLIAYLYRLQEANCRLYDSNGHEWTGEDIGTTISAVVEGEKSKGEQTSKSHRVLGAKVAKARNGEWQGGAVGFGFDVACFARETDDERWRNVSEGRDKRIKVFPNRETERFDGKGNFPKCQPQTEVLRLAPSRDKKKIAAAVGVFKRYANEEISFTALAHWLNEAGWRNGFGNPFTGLQVQAMLEDPIYLGFYAYNKRHFGKFHRYAKSQVIPEFNYDECGSKNDKDDWVQSKRLFTELISQSVWDKVQKKLAQRTTRAKAPTSASYYLSGLLYCGNCGTRMVAGPQRKSKKKGHAVGMRCEYFCGAYHKAHATRQKCSCQRNGVFQNSLDTYIEQYLNEAGHRLDLLTTGSDSDNPFAQQESQEEARWRVFRDGMKRLTGYLAERHSSAYCKVLDLTATEYFNSEDYTHLMVECFREHHDAGAIAADLEKLRQEHDRLVSKWSDLPTPRAKDTAKLRLQVLDDKMKELEAQQENIGAIVEDSYREMQDLQQAMAKAQLAIRNGTDERAMRRKAAALRSVIQRIECTFVATGEKGSGWGKRKSKLVRVTICPVSGKTADYSFKSPVQKSTLKYSSAHSCI